LYVNTGTYLIFTLLSTKAASGGELDEIEPAADDTHFLLDAFPQVWVIELVNP